MVAVVAMQLLVFDSMHLGVFFEPLVYVAFLVLLPLNTKPVVMLALGLMTGVFVDFFEGTAGLHTAVALMTAFVRRNVIVFMLGRDALEEERMPSFASTGVWKFIRYSATVTTLHCLVFFSLEALSWSNMWLVMAKTAVSGTVTLVAVWAVALLFMRKIERKT